MKKWFIIGGIVLAVLYFRKIKRAPESMNAAGKYTGGH